MIILRIKNSRISKLLSIICIMTLPFIQPEKDQPAYANASSTQGTVIATDLNVRKAADSSSKIIGLAHKEDTFEIIQTQNGWDQILLSNNQTGWVNDAYIITAEDTEAIVVAPVLNIREEPGLSSQVVGQLKSGEKITIHEEQGEWAKIVSPSGVSGWVNEYYITKNTPSKHQTQPVGPTSKTTPSHTTDKNSMTQSRNSTSTSGTQMTTQSINTVLKQNSQEPLKGKTIVLDPGHGGKDDGTTSYVGTHEKTLTLETAQIVKQKLKNAGANVIMTRTNDTFIPLQQRAEISNKNHADAFISFHYNWSNDTSVNGVTDFYYQKSKDNELASDVLNEVVKATKLNNIGTRFDDLSVLRNNLQPSTLIELGFLSSKKDDPVVESSTYRENVAKGVYLGLLDYFSNKK
ncbi:N-acetylmuramoyl-L-alanine amidase [Bacillus sp. EB600]|uniref:N-acetylmuramoyl-L-alanine amidase n=1 Tax=Bacillus sp. EB600 TaxID=2806345 RepID=UPI00210E9317|nr:N-acetylmuramoyl-L-alanine amidase [Bacillus sp. EB600]MCQ6281951.1 N-acetylmuramoyl-L-alanine amidase [Bacillus sp. EB600]